MKQGAFKKLMLTTLLGGTLAAATVQAHPVWMLPGEFNVSADKPEWVSVDATASHTVFGVDKGFSLTDLRITTPEGKTERIGNYFKGHRRSVFDFELDQEGTYQLKIEGKPRIMTTYKIGKRGTQKRGMFDKREAQTRLPEGAFDVQTISMSRKSLAYVTRKAPTDTVLEVTGKGFELKPATHPNDIIAGEAVEMTLLMNGKPAVNAEVKVTAAGTKYRDDRGNIELTTDAKGLLTFTPTQAGPYLLTAKYKEKADSARYDVAANVIFLTFEAQAE